MITFKENLIPNINDTIELYKSVGWDHIKNPKALIKALSNSDSIITAWNGDKLVGLGRAISDKSLTVYFPDLLIHPDWQRKGVGTQIMETLLSKYIQFHNQVIVAEDSIARKFYKKIGFVQNSSALSITKPFSSE